MAKNRPDPESDDPPSSPSPGEFPELPPILPGPFDYEEEEDEGPRTILITGAAGNLGSKLALAWADDYDLLLLDSDPRGRDDIIVADLSKFDDSWLQYFEEADTVIHLAANPSEFASWEELEKPNLDALANVLNACVMAAVDRIIFASSNHVMGGYRELGDMPITTDLPPRPINAYGASKLVGERLGKSLADATETTFIALRLGWCQGGRNKPDTLPDDWARSLWLSDSDMVRLFEFTVEAELDEKFLVLNGLSNNRGTRWDLAMTELKLGFVPEDDSYTDDL